MATAMMLNLSVLRIDKNMSQGELALKSGVSRSFICELESGKKRACNVEIACKLAQALEVSIEELVLCCQVETD